MRPVLAYLMRGIKVSSSDGRDGMSVCELSGLLEEFSCQGAILTFLSNVLSFNKNC